jgi:predicted HTH domain antitoxin
MKIEIPDSLLKQGNISQRDLLCELVTILYSKTELSWSAAAQLLNISRDQFLQELGKRKIPVKYSIDDLQADLQNFVAER